MFICGLNIKNCHVDKGIKLMGLKSEIGKDIWKLLKKKWKNMPTWKKRLFLFGGLILLVVLISPLYLPKLYNDWKAGVDSIFCKKEKVNSTQIGLDTIEIYQNIILPTKDADTVQESKIEQPIQVIEHKLQKTTNQTSINFEGVNFIDNVISIGQQGDININKTNKNENKDTISK